MVGEKTDKPRVVKKPRKISLEELKEIERVDEQFQRLQQQMNQIQEDQKRMGETVKAARGASGPGDDFTAYYRVKGEIDRIMEVIKPHLALSDATQIKLKELELQQQRELSRAEADNTRSKQLFDMVTVLGRDYMEMKRAEIRNKESLQAETIQGLSDLVAAIGAVVDRGKK